MKILNIVLSILILILAVVAAVFSYMLFEKREQMVGGYEKLSNGINQAAKVLDADSGTNYANELDKKTLSHTSESLQDSISKLAKQAREIASERQNTAEALVTIFNASKGFEDNSQLTVKEITNIKTSAESVGKVVRQVEELQANRDQIVAALDKAARNLDINLSVNKLRSADRKAYSDELSVLSRDLGDLKKYKKMQETAMKDIAESLGVKGLTFSPVRYQEDLNKYTAAIDGLRKDRADLQAARKSLTDQLGAANGEIAKLKAEVAKLNDEVTRRVTDYDRLQAAVEGKVYQYPVELWQPGSLESRKAVEGKVIDVNTKFGYVVIDLGANTVVNQYIGENLAPAPVNPEIAADNTMIVSRDTKYIGRIKIFKVEGNCAFASVVDGSESGISKGDTVFFESAAE